MEGGERGNKKTLNVWKRKWTNWNRIGKEDGKGIFQEKREKMKKQRTK